MEHKKEDFNHSVPIQIRFNDIDAIGHINNNIYFSYFDLAKSFYLEEVRGNAINWIEGNIVIAHIEADFLSPTFYKEEIAVYSKIIHLGTKSATFLQQVRNIKTNDIKCICKSVFVYLDNYTMKSSPIPELWKLAINKFEKDTLLNV